MTGKLKSITGQGMYIQEQYQVGKLNVWEKVQLRMNSGYG